MRVDVREKRSPYSKETCRGFESVAGRAFSDSGEMKFSEAHTTIERDTEDKLTSSIQELTHPSPKDDHKDG